MLKLQSCALIMFICQLFPLITFADELEEKGFAIEKAALDYDNGFVNVTARMKMILINKAGDTSTRRIRIKILEVDGDGDKSLSIFDEPLDVKGTAMLTYSHGLEADDQWLYLPALRKVKRINSRNKSGPFMGSTFAFEDLGSQELEKYSYRLLHTETCGDWECNVIERKPQYEHSGYSRQVLWRDKVGHRVVKVEYYDRKNALLKTLIVSRFMQYLGHYWRPASMEMSNHVTGKSTRLEWSDYQFKTEIRERDFRPQSLKRLQ